MIAFTDHDPELQRFARAVLEDLSAAGALADYLDDHDPPTAPYISGKPSLSRGEMLRRRWKVWRRSRNWRMKKFDSYQQHRYVYPWDRIEAQLRDVDIIVLLEGQIKIADDSFARYIRYRFLPRATRI